MKTIFFILFFGLTTLIIAQPSPHLSFKGVPIDGTLTEFVSKMKQSDFTHLGTEEGLAILKGDFAGYKNCQVGVSTLKQKDLVYKIGVLFPEADTWSKLSENYFELKQKLTEKYGKPSECIEKFEGHSQPQDDSKKIYDVKFDRCKYYTIWQTDKGEIQLSIDHISVSSCFVKLLYFDKINSAIINAKAIDDL
jgi:hypothetical protein